jgi:D-alanyl-D-alanine carboxypeptidase
MKLPSMYLSALRASRLAARAAIALLFCTLAFGQATTADAPAQKALADYLEAFNSGDVSRMHAFDVTWRPEMPIAKMRSWRAMTGGFTLLRVEKSDSLSITALLQEKNSDTVARLQLEVSPDDPTRIIAMSFLAIPRPADLAIAHMSEGDAVAALSARADELAKRDRFSGAILFAKNGNILIEKAWGRADRELGTKASVETQFRIGSMNKMFTAVAVLQLVEAGKLALSDPILKFLPDYPNKDLASKVTVRNLLTHTGGTRDIFGQAFVENRMNLKEHGDYLKLYGARDQVPGGLFSYSNYGFVLLGALIEKVSGMSYYDYVQKNIFAPAGMTSTGSLPEVESVPNRAQGYMQKQGAWVSNADTLPWRGTAAGGGYSTVGDLLRFAGALEAGKLISKAMLAEATRIQEPPYGYGFFPPGEGALRHYGHAGGAPGMSGELRIYPQLGYVIVALSNLDPPVATQMVEFVAARMPAAAP